VLNPGSALAGLFAAPMRPGRIEWIGLRPARRAAMVAVAAVQADSGRGLLGDRHVSEAGARQVTLIQGEHLTVIAGFLGAIAAVEPARLRRNIVVRGINLLALKDCRVRIGGACLHVTGECHPCSRMEEALGTGGYNAMRGHGGITARIVSSGTIRVGDMVERIDGDVGSSA
jgi:MOSC domain-containing protein YiiM